MDTRSGAGIRWGHDRAAVVGQPADGPSLRVTGDRPVVAHSSPEVCMTDRPHVRSALLVLGFLRLCMPKPGEVLDEVF